MKKATKAILLAGVLTLSLPVLAFRGGMGDGFDGRHHDPMQKFERMSLMLDLTDEQIAQVRPVIEQQMKDKVERHNRKDSMRDLRKAIDNGASQAEIEAIADKAASAVKQRILDRAKVMSAMNQVLTPEQKEKLEKLKSLRENRMSRHMKH
ncbi:Spy/CpxP family protein refolding chaperone [Litoribrevibacter euphylliae]|uniref:Spy/CpxP family protein refolding chaperone n=1 Tax=Litoribrevibacter euphylliae TaxID=1834034 RepID=A0ABV7HCB0_9GAMM